MNKKVIEEHNLIRKLTDEQEADFYLFNSEINRDSVTSFINLCKKEKSRKNVSLLICTNGGDGDAAYMCARYLKNQYDCFRLYIFGLCKSAGTLLALGADEIIMSNTGELGPLDIQILKDDILSPRGSGLDTINAINALREYTFSYFENYLLELKRRSGFTISTRIASDIACKLVVGIIAPIMEQIDPIRIGEIQRSLSIAYDYGKRLCNSDDIVSRLTYEYPSHSFVIDYHEAKEFLPNVRLSTSEEQEFELELTEKFVEKLNRDVVHEPIDDTITIKLNKSIIESKNG